MSVTNCTILKLGCSFCSECWTIMQHRQWHNDQHRKDFESGVRMGVGCFNLMISLLPARVMKLLEWIGFGGNKVLTYDIVLSFNMKSK